MNQMKRIEWLDIVKYICIMFVMLSHLEANTEFLWEFYSPFFLSAFFFCSGYVHKPNSSFKKFLFKKFRQLFVPWLVFSVFNILLSQIISFNEHRSLLSELQWNFLQIRGLGDEIWFVAALFVAFIPFYFFIKWYEQYSITSDLKNRKYNKCFVAILIAWILSLVSILYSRLMPSELLPWGRSALPWHIEYIFQAMFYMVLGYIFRREFESKFDQYNKQINRFVVWIIYLLMVYVPYFTGVEFPVFIDILYDYILTLLGIIAIVMVSKRMKPNRYMSYVGQNTLIYFALHGKAYSLIQTALHMFVGGYVVILGNTILSSLFAFFLTLVLSVLLIIPSYVINRWFPFILGRSKKRN